MGLDASIVIDRPVGDVWRFYAVNHVQNHPRWQAEVLGRTDEQFK